MRSWFLFAIVPVLFTVGCGAADDQGYCISAYDESFAGYAVPEYDGTGCVWARKSECGDAGGDWIDYVDTEFDYAEDTEGDGLAGYCASEGFAVDCASEGVLFAAAEGNCPAGVE